MPTSTLSNLLHRVITRVRRRHTIRGLTTLGVDEISYCKGRKFATLVYDLDRARVLWVGQGKGRDTIDRFFNDWLSRGQKARVAWASCDMSPAYIGAITHHCPHVTLVIDRFHLVKALNQAVDEVRKEQWRALDTQGRKAIKGLRWLLSRHSRHRTKGHTRFLNNLRNSNRRIHRAWVLKDEFEHFWDYRYPASAKKFLRRWMTAALRSRLPTMRTFVGTLRTHLVHILAFIDRPLTNAVGEGLNRMIKIVKNRASGYRHLDYFADMIYLTVGDLDIPVPTENLIRTVRVTDRADVGPANDGNVSIAAVHSVNVDEWLASFGRSSGRRAVCTVFRRRPSMAVVRPRDDGSCGAGRPRAAWRCCAVRKLTRNVPYPQTR